MGIGSLDANGYLDFLYVAPYAQRRGVASLILQHLESEAFRRHETEIRSHVSKTALPFFRKNGFQTISDKVNQLGQERLVNFEMKKILKD